MRVGSRTRIVLVALGALVGASWAVPSAQAVPSYARQTGFSCAQCHTIYPELTPLGRRFKLTGYLLTTTPSQGTEKEEYVLNRTPPISAMVQISATQTQKDVPDANAANGGKAQNETVAFPQQLSLFYAGRISANTGAFIQMTYSGPDDAFSMDNADIRVVGQGGLGGAPFVYGLTLNNNPGVQDLWNSTPAFGFPYASSASAPAPGTGIMLDGALGQQVAGLGGYAALMMNHSFLYAELTAYKAAQLGPPQPLDSTAASPVVRDTAPYLRAAYEVNWSTASLEVGAIGMNATLLPTNVQQDPNCKPSIPSINDATVVPCALKGLNQVRPNRFYDSGIDAQFDYIPSNEHIFTLKGVWLHEDQSWGADAGAAHASNHLDTQRVTGSYYHNRSEGIIAQWFSTTGSKDAGLYGGDGSTFGNRTNLPDSSGYVVELVYIPALNVRYSLQSVMYEKFNGAATHYDLADPKRNASDNNTLYLLAWLMF